MKIDSSFLKCFFQFGVSVIVGLCGIALICLWPVIFDELMTLKPNSVLYKFWYKLPVDIATDHHFFNWTNSEDVYNFSVKPRFEEVGPYRFWQKERKVNITWNNNGTVTFQQQKFWHYDDEAKIGNLDDAIITGSPVSIGAAYIIRHWNYFVKKGVFMTLSGGGLISLTIKKTIRELLYDGYPEPLIKIVRSLPFFTYLNLPAWKNFGWLYQRNGSSEFDGVFNMGTGVNSTFGKIYFWNYKNRTPYFDGSCADVFGSAGQFFPRNLKKDSISFYSPDIRLSGTFRFVKEEIVSNILGYKYIAEEYILDNGTIYPKNKCFCNGECTPSGMVNISNTRFGLPLFVSLPHFYQADPHYSTLIDGMKPDKKKHEFSLVVEPTTGIPLKIHIAAQVNLLVQSNSGSHFFEKVQKFFLPVMWTKQSYEAKGFLAFLIKLLVNFGTVCVAIGSLMILTSIALLSVMTYKKYTQHIHQKTKDMQFLQEQRLPLQTEFEEKPPDFYQIK